MPTRGSHEAGGLRLGFLSAFAGGPEVERTVGPSWDRPEEFGDCQEVNWEFRACRGEFSGVAAEADRVEFGGML